MEKRKVFNADITETDSFLDMPTSAQCLYFHLGMKRNDIGYIHSPKKIVKMCGCTLEDLETLKQSGFITKAGSGVYIKTRQEHRARESE